MSKNKFIAIEVADQKLTAVEFGLGWQGLTLYNYASMEIPEGVVDKGAILDWEKLVKLFKLLLEQGKPSAIKAKNVILLLDDAVMFHHLFEFKEAQSLSRLEDLLRLSIEQTIPFKDSEIYFDFQQVVLGKEEQQRTKVQFLGAPRFVVDGYVSAFKELGLELIQLTSPKEIYKSVFALEEGEAPFVILEFNLDRINILIFENGLLVDEDELGVGVEEFLDRMAESQNQPVEKFKQMLANKQLIIDQQDPFFQQVAAELALELPLVMSKCSVKAIYCWGPGVKIDGLISGLNVELKQNLGFSVLWKPLVINKRLKSNPDLVQTINHNLASFGRVIAAGRTLLTGSMPVRMLNLLPKELKQKSSNMLQFSLYNRFSMLILAVSLALIFFVSFSVLSNRMELLQLQRQTQNFDQLIYGERYEMVRSDILSFNERVGNLHNLATSLQQPPALLADILKMPAEGIELNGLAYERLKSEIKLSGIASTRKSLLDFQEKLGEIIEEGELSSPLSNFDESEKINFTLILNLKPSSNE